jgi:hypothetical protein
MGLLTGLRTKTIKKKHANKSNTDNERTDREPLMKNQIVVSAEIHAQENAHDGRLSPNQGLFEIFSILCQ